jgi:ornithine cyclodeaminase
LDIEEKISEVDIVSCATLSKTPLVLGKFVKTSQHINRVRTYKKEMREADNALITKASIFVDTPAGLHESGDISIPLNSGILTENDIKGNLFSLSAKEVTGRKSNEEITLFKSVGHALEDLMAANYYYKKFNNA